MLYEKQLLNLFTFEVLFEWWRERSISFSSNPFNKFSTLFPNKLREKVRVAHIPDGVNWGEWMVAFLVS